MHSNWKSLLVSVSSWYEPLTNSNLQAAPITVHISTPYKSYTDKHMTGLLHIGVDNKGRLFYATVHSLMMGQQGLKHIGVDVLKHYCNSNELCAFVGLH